MSFQIGMLIEVEFGLVICFVLEFEEGYLHGILIAILIRLVCVLMF